MSVGNIDRRWISDLVAATVSANSRRNPPAQFKSGTVIVDDQSATRGIGVRVDGSDAIIYPDNVTGSPLRLNSRVMVVLAGDASLIIGRWPATLAELRLRRAGSQQDFPDNTIADITWDIADVDTEDMWTSADANSVWIRSDGVYTYNWQIWSVVSDRGPGALFGGVLHLNNTRHLDRSLYSGAQTVITGWGVGNGGTRRLWRGDAIRLQCMWALPGFGVGVLAELHMFKLAS
jgi:hypothetical protein